MCPSRIRLRAFRIACSLALISLEQTLRLSHSSSERDNAICSRSSFGRSGP
jgi:hypothetical protein